LGYVYFLELSNGDIYVGSTNELRCRFSSTTNSRVVRKPMPAPERCGRRG